MAARTIHGFTLIEVLVYVGVIGGILTSFILFSLSVSESRQKAYVAQEVQGSLRTSVDIVTGRLRAATGVNTGSSTFDVDPGILSLVMADPTKNPTIIDLSADDGSLRITEGAGSPEILTGPRISVTHLVFRDLTVPSSGRENIGIELTFSAIGDGQAHTYSKSARTSVSIRQ